MKLSKLREILLLIVPILALVALGIYFQQPRGDGSLKLVKTEVAYLPNHITEVNFVVKYDSPSPLPEFVTRPRFSGAFLGVSDMAGKLLEFGTSSMQCGPTRNYFYCVKCQFSVAKIPKRISRISVNGQIKVGNTVLPLSKILKH